MGNDLIADIADYLAFHLCERETTVECSLAESLWRIVRRILRTQSKQTRLEIRVLGEARRVASSHCEEFTRDVLAKLVVDELLTGRHAGHFNVETCGMGQDWPSERALLLGSTVVP